MLATHALCYLRPFFLRYGFVSLQTQLEAAMNIDTIEAQRKAVLDFEATETLIRTAALEGAAKRLSVLFDKANDLVRGQEHACAPCGQAMRRAGMRA